MSATNNFTDEFHKLLTGMEKFGASDLHLKVGCPPVYRVKTKPQRLKVDPVASEFVEAIGFGAMNPIQKETFEQTGAADLSYSVPGSGRFRINFYRQRGSFSLVARRIPFDIPELSKLNLPPVVEQFADFNDGLMLVVGMTGSGKSTTLASILHRINQKKAAHILTIEDPIEFLHSDQRSFINQREIGSDASDFAQAIRAAMRQDPDVILVGEIRDAETMETALAAAETGHLVLGTLHAIDTTQTLSRILDFFPAERQESIRQILAMTLQAVLAQKILPGAKPEAPLVPAVEILLAKSAVRKFIAENEEGKVRDCLRSMSGQGLQDFNMSLMDLVNRGMITAQTALSRSPNPDQLKMNLRGMSSSMD